MSELETLLADPFARKQFLAILEPYDPDLMATVPLYFSDFGLTTSPGSEPPNQYFAPRLMSALNFERHLFKSGKLSGRSVPGYGEIELNNADGGLDDLGRLAFDGRRVRVFIGGADFAFESFAVIFDGTADSAEFTDESVSIRLRDLQLTLDQPIQETTYLGTGDLEGPEALTGKPKPLTFGHVFHISPVLIKSFELVYQVHDGPIEDVVSVHDSGVALTKTTGTPSFGQFSVDLALGTFQLGGTPAGQITAEVKGDKTDGVFVSTVPDVIRRIVLHRSVLSADGLDQESFEATNAGASAPIGIHIDTDTTVAAVLDELVGSIGAHYGFSRGGLLTIGRLGEPGSTGIKTFTDREILELERRATGLPIWRQRVGYRRYWSPLDAAGVADAVAMENRQDLAEGFRLAEASDATVQTVHPLAGDERSDGALVTKEDAQAEADRLLLLYGQDRQSYRVRVKAQPFTLDLGQSVTVVYPRHGLDSGKTFLVVGMAEESAVNEVELTLWG